jgi:hypothetical protein
MVATPYNSSFNWDLPPLSTISEKPGLSTNNQGFLVAAIAINPVFGGGAIS